MGMPFIQEMAVAVQTIQGYWDLPAVDVTPPGVAIRAQWAGVYGATRAEITSALVRIGPAELEQPLSDLTVNALSSKKIYEITIPAGRRVRSLTLNGLKTADGASITSVNNLPAGHRLVVSVKEGGTEGPPLYSVPSVGSRGMLPAMLTGASFDNKVLKLPDLAASRIRLALVTGGVPEEFSRQPFELGSVSGVGVVLPTDLELVDPEGVVLWNFPGEFPAQQAPVSYDLGIGLSAALSDALKANQPLDKTFRLRGKTPGKAGFSFSGARGALVRDFPGVITTELQGDPAAIPLGDTLAPEQPQSVGADLTVTYQNMRVLDLPVNPAALGDPPGGEIVMGQSVTRALPPQAVGDLPLVKVGLVGRAPENCELSVQVVEMGSGAALGPPGVLKLSASYDLCTQWVDLPANVDLSGNNLGIAVRANQGRFFWVSRGGELQLKLAVYDPDPGGRALRLGGVPLLGIDRASIHHPAQMLPPSAFRTSAPLLESSLFLTVDLSDMTIRYAR